MSDKKIWYLDLDETIVGVFQGFDPHVGDPGLVYVKYSPANSLKTLKDKKPISKDKILMHTPTNNDKPGVPDQVMVKLTGAEGGVVHNFIQKYVKENDELKNENYDLKMEVQSLRTQLQSAQSGVKKAVSEATQLTASQRQRTPFGSPYPYGGITGDDMLNDY